MSALAPVVLGSAEAAPILSGMRDAACRAFELQRCARKRTRVATGIAERDRGPQNRGEGSTGNQVKKRLGKCVVCFEDYPKDAVDECKSCDKTICEDHRRKCWYCKRIFCIACKRDHDWRGCGEDSDEDSDEDAGAHEAV